MSINQLSGIALTANNLISKFVKVKMDTVNYTDYTFVLESDGFFIERLGVQGFYFDPALIDDTTLNLVIFITTYQ